MHTKLFFGLLFCCSLLVGFGELSAQSDRPFSAGLTEQFPYQNYAGQQVYNLTRAQQFLRNGQWEQAILTFDIALAQQPFWVPALVGRSNVLQLVGRELEAERDRELALRLNRTATQVLLARGRQQPIRFLALYPEEWMRDYGFEPGASLRPGRPHAAFAGNFDYFNFQSDRIRAAPDSCQVTQAIRYKLSGEYAYAENLLLDQTDYGTEDRALIPMLRANLRLANHDYLAAIALYNEALREYGEDWPELYYNRGVAYVLLNNYTNGCTDLARSMEAGFVPATELFQSMCNF